MRQFFSFFLILAVLPAWASRRVTVGDVQKLLDAARGEKDSSLAKELAGLELTERVSSAQLAQWQAGFAGKKTRQELLLLADASAFLDLPATKIPDQEPPDQATQRQIVSQAVDYVRHEISRLPNFFATRDTTRFVNVPSNAVLLEESPNKERPLHFLDQTKATVLVRDGKEVVDSGKAKPAAMSPFSKGITTEGVFGPILGIVIVDAGAGTVSWSHWEQDAEQRRAVFRYMVPKEKSHFELEWCCTVAKRENSQAYWKGFKEFAAYHGEIAIDPETGVIRRLTVVADSNPGSPVANSSIAVEYGPVEIGGKTYICPARSIAYSLTSIQFIHLSQPDQPKEPTAMETSLNDVVFGEYHLFRGETRILSADEAGAIPPSGNEIPAATPASQEKPQR